MLSSCLGIGVILCNWTTCWAFHDISLHVIISYTCWVLYVLTIALFLAYYCCARLLSRWGVLWWRLLLGVRTPRSSAYGKMVSYPLLSAWTCNKFFCYKIRCNKHWLYYLFHYLLLYVWNLILAHIKKCIQFWPKNLVWHKWYQSRVDRRMKA
jgi:hypothetical protein